MTTYDDKKEAVKQWTHDPCGLLGAEGIEIGSREFYETVDRNRYERYAPWMKTAIGFDRMRDKRLLEVGFGMGTDLFQFAAAGALVSGIDLSPRHLDIARRRFELFGLEADLRIADAEAIPHPDGTFDAVYSFGVIHHTPNIQKALDEIHRVLVPGGEAIVAVYHLHSAFHWFCVFGGHVFHRRFLRESYRRTLSRIEYRANSDACPLVNLYSRRSLRRLLNRFSRVTIDCAHLDTTHFGRLGPVVPERLVPKLERRLGWYLIARCLK